MDLTLSSKHNFIVEFLNTIFIKWWQVGTGVVATWMTAIFSGRLLLFIPPTPENLKVWIPIITTGIVGLVTVFFLYRLKNRELRNVESKHEQELMQDEIEDCRKMWLAFLEHKKIPDTMTLVDFKIQHYDKIKQAFQGTKHA